MKKIFILLSVLICTQITTCNFIKSAQSPIVYSVSYDMNGAEIGIAPIDAHEYVYNDVVSVLDNISLSKYGYTFNGWNTTTNNTGITYTIGSTFHIVKSITLYAIWTKNITYTITYDANGATSGTVPTDVTAYQANQICTIQGNVGNLAKEYYTFAGWCTATDGNGSVYLANSPLSMTHNVTLYAKWTKNSTYTITYNSNGADSGIVPVDVTHYEYGQSANVMDNVGNLHKSNYKFIKWNTQVDGKGTSYLPGVSIALTDNITVYAVWSKIYTITYDANGATSGDVPIDDKQYLMNDSAIILNNLGNLFKPGYTFVRWNTQADGNGTNYSSGVNIEITGNVKLYATFQENPKYTITYDANGATSGTVPPVYSYEEGINTVLDTNTGVLNIVGDSMIGWNTLPDGSGTTYQLGQTFTVGHGDTVLYALWGGTPDITYTLNADSNSYTVSSLVYTDTIRIPKYHNGKMVTALANNLAQYNNYIISVTLPNSITSIGERCFSSCNELITINWPTSLTSIGANAFVETKINNGIFPNSLSFINNSAFASSALTNVYIPKSVSLISNNAFYNCTQLSSVTFDANSPITTIATELFSSCGALTSVTLPNNITEIKANAFSNCAKLTTINLPSTPLKLNSYCFYNTGLENVTIYNSYDIVGAMSVFSGCKKLKTVTLICDYCNKTFQTGFFKNCTALTTLNIQSNNGYIKFDNQEIFYGCTALTTINGSEYIYYFGDYCFSGCSLLKEIRLLENPPSVSSDSFYNCTALTIYVPSASVNSYKAASGWSVYASKIVGY